MTSDKMPDRLAKSGTDDIGDLLAQLRAVIREGRQQALRAVDVVQVRTCWAVGRHIVEYEQGGASRAAFGARLVSKLAERHTDELVRERRLLETP